MSALTLVTLLAVACTTPVLESSQIQPQGPSQQQGPGQQSGPGQSPSDRIPPPPEADEQELDDKEQLDGYTLITPLGDNHAYLVDMDGNLAHKWELNGKSARAVYLLEDGNLLATYHVPSDYFQARDFAGGGIEILDWDGNQLWSYELSNEQYSTHHDVELMPNGNILAIAYERIVGDYAIAMGFDSRDIDEYGSVWSESIFEIDPNTNSIVWEWHVKDHLLSDENTATRDSSKLIDPKYPEKRRPEDWLHLNSIDYNEELDQILLSAFITNEIFIIDHSISTKEAKGPAGDLLFRWGNPEAYSGSGKQKLFGQHNAQWIDDKSSSSNILLFNNGDPVTRTYSTVMELELKADDSYQPGDIKVIWEYGDDNDEESFFSYTISGVQRLENGNTLICSGMEERVIEINSDGEKVWEFTNTEYGTSMRGQKIKLDLFRAERYYLDLSSK